MDVHVSDLFRAGFAKLFPFPEREAILQAIRFHARIANESNSTLFYAAGDRELRVMRRYVHRRVGHVRVFFERSADQIVLWHVSSSSA